MDLTEKEYCAAKFAKILLTIGVEQARYFIEKLISKLNFSDVDTFFHYNFQEIKAQKNLYHFKVIYRHIVKVENGKPSYKQGTNLDEFDISALCSIGKNILLDYNFCIKDKNYLIINKSNLIQSYGVQKGHLERLAKIRNDYYGHLVFFKMEMSEMEKITNELLGIYSCLCEPKNIPKIKKQIEELKRIDSPQLAKQEIKMMIQKEIMSDRDFFQDFIIRSLTKFDELNSGQMELKSRIEDLIDLCKDGYGKLEEILDAIQDQSNLKIDEISERIFLSIDDKIDQSTKQIIENTNECSWRNQETIKQSYQKVLEKINEKEYVLQAKYINSSGLKEAFMHKRFTSNYNILVLSKRNCQRNNQLINRTVSAFNWDTVIDLDRQCEKDSNGLTQAINKSLYESYQRKIKFYNIGDPENLSTYEQPIYILADGSEERTQQENITKRVFKSKISAFFDKLIKNHSYRTFRITVVLLKDSECDVDSEEYFSRIRNVLKSFENAKKDLDSKVISDIYVLIPRVEQNNDKEILFKILNKIDTNVKICQDDLNNLAYHLLDTNRIRTKPEYRSIPRIGNDPKILDKDGFYPYENPDKKILELYDINCGEITLNIKDPEEIKREARRFLSGEKQITPEIINLSKRHNIYAIRDINETISKKIREKIDSQLNANEKINPSAFSDYVFKIFHEPSAGGTTVGRLLLYEFRTLVPSVEVLDLTDYVKVRDGIDFLSKEVEQNLPILVLIDNPVTSLVSTVEDLIDDLRSRKIKTIIIIVKRLSVMKNIKEEDNEFAVQSEASEQESLQFEKIKKCFCLVPNEKKAENNSEFQVDQPQYVYLYGLGTFDKEFKKQIMKMIDNHMKDWTEELNIIFLLSCASHKYGAFPLSLRFISLILGINWNFACKFYDIYETDKEYTMNNLETLILNEFKKKCPENQLTPNESDFEEKHANQLKVLSYYLGKARHKTDNIIKGLMPFTSLIGECIIEKLCQTTNKFESIFIKFKKLRGFMFNESDKITVNELLCQEFVTLSIKIFGGIQKQKTKTTTTVTKSGKKSRSTNEVDDWVRYSQFILDSRDCIGSRKTYEHFNDIYRSFASIGMFKYAISSTFSKFLFFLCEDIRDNKTKAIDTMKDALGIKVSVREEINSYVNGEFWPILLATYANLSRHYLNTIGKDYKCNNQPHEIKCQRINNFTQNIEEIILACEKSYELNHMYPMPVFIEVKSRMKMIQYYFYEYCESNRHMYSDSINNKQAPAIVLISENRLCQLLWKLEQFDELGYFDSGKTYSIGQKIASFKFNPREILSHSLKNNPFYLNIFQYFSSLKSNKIKMWSDFDKSELSEIIECCEILIEKGFTSPSNLKDLMLAYIHYQRFTTDMESSEYLDKALYLAETWCDFTRKIPKNQFIIENSKLLSNYFYSILCLLKVKELENESTSEDQKLKLEFSKLIHQNYSTAFKEELKSLVENFNYQYYITKEHGLKALKPRSLYVFSPKNTTENLIELKENELQFFRGPLIRDNNSYYLAIISATIHKNEALRAHYSKAVSLKYLSKNIDTNEIYEFALFVKPGKIFMVLPKRQVENKEEIKYDWCSAKTTSNTQNYT